MITKILFITLSNIGDVVLTLPVMDLFRERFPLARFTVVVGLRPKELFEADPAVEELIIFNKQAPLREKMRLALRLRKGGFDAVIDMRNSLLGVVVPARYKTSPFTLIPRSILHMRERHLWKVRPIARMLAIEAGARASRGSLRVLPADEENLKNFLRAKGVADGEAIAVVAAGARSHTKRWPAERFLAICQRLASDYGIRSVLVGDAEDRESLRAITDGAAKSVVDALGQTSLAQLVALVARAKIVLTNDSAVSHIASYLDLPVVTVFGISDEALYGPWSTRSAVAVGTLSCRPCRRARCEHETLACIRSVDTETVWKKTAQLLEA